MYKSAELHGVMSLFVRRAEQLQRKLIEALHGPVRPSGPLPTCPIGLGGGVNGDRRRVVKAKCCYVAFKCSQIRESEQAMRRAASLAPALFRRPDRHVKKDCGNRGLVAPLLIRSLQHTWSHSHFSPRLTSNTQYMYSVFWKSKACLIQRRV